ncbi:RAVE protein 1 C terminal-domain-containing protein [Dichotomocladium elegans]|nr:RAVE protein 1 C terminal-domain-containing protein [Dichotomocladium elegans]
MRLFHVCESYESDAPLSSLFTFSIHNDSNGVSVLLVGVSKQAKRAFTWQLQPSEDGTAHITFRGVHMFPWDSEPDVIATSGARSANITSTLFHQLGSISDRNLSLAVAIGSSVKCYGAHQEFDQDVRWEDLYTLETSFKDIKKIRCVANLMVIVSATEDGSPSRLVSIWTDIRSNVSPTMRVKLTFSDPVKDVAWNISSDGQFILAIAFPKKVAIYGEKRADDMDTELDQWVPYAEFVVDTPDEIVAVAWIGGGVLAVASGNQIRCYLKWLTSSDQIVPHMPLDAEFEPLSNIYDESYELNGPLPFYHPKHLIHYLMWGKLKLINAVLLTLYRFLRHIDDDEDISEDQIPTIPLLTVLEIQNEKDAKRSDKQAYEALFNDIDDGGHDIDNENDQIRPLTNKEREYLIAILKERKLPALSESDRMHLVAMVDTFVEISSLGESLDENGARFTALLENFYHLREILPENQRNRELGSRDMVWALHSQSQDMLLERCVRLCGGKIMWEDARSLGLFLWLQKADVVTEQMTMIARNTYLAQEIKDPVSCTLFYLALRKKTLLQSLWRTASHHKEQAIMVKFLANDFSQPRWQTAAAKNAFVLLGRQRYAYAAAFFLLADKLKDAVNVILKNLQDYQLAIAICRVYEGDHSPLLKDILKNTVLPHATAAKDRWLVSMVFTLLGDKREALRALVVCSSMVYVKITKEDESAANVSDPNLFILYHHLRKQMRLQNQREFEISPSLEYLFSLNVSRAYERLGCPMLALFIITTFAKSKPIERERQRIENESCRKGKESRAADLFADDSPVINPYSSDKASDLFADEPKLSRAADLFADEPSVSRAEDLFADETDIFAGEDPKHRTGGLFDDEDEENSQLESNVETSEQQEENREDDGLARYKALLAIRMLQTIFHAASALYSRSSAPHRNINYQEAFKTIRKNMMVLSETAQVPYSSFSRLLMEKSIEVDMFGAYLRLIESNPDEKLDVVAFSNAFKTGCLQIFKIALQQQDFSYGSLAFIEGWADAWNKLHEEEESGSYLQTPKLALNAYITLLLTTLKQRHYEKCWTLISNLKTFLESLVSPDKLTECLKKILQGETKMPDMDLDDFEAFSDDSLFGYNMDEEVYRPLHDYRDKASGANMLEISSLNYMLITLESYMKKEDKPDDLYSMCMVKKCDNLLTHIT